MGVGNYYTSLLDVNHSFKEALEALHYRNIASISSIFWFNDIPHTQIGYYYPMDLETRLINLVKNGDLKETLANINTLYEKNFVHIRLSSEEISQLIYEIRGTILKTKRGILDKDDTNIENVDILLEQMDNCMSAEGFYEIITKIYKLLCTYVNEKKKGEENQLIKVMLEYINKHYLDNMMSLYNVASKFQITEQYLSLFFKERTGENFSSYIERLRMKQAKMLLEKNSLPVSDIVREAGYINDNTFYKAFKRIYGISPSVYRKNFEKGL